MKGGKLKCPQAGQTWPDNRTLSQRFWAGLRTGQDGAEGEKGNCSYCLWQSQKVPGLMGIPDHLWGALKPLLGVTLGCCSWVLRMLNPGCYREAPWEGRELITGQVSGVGFRWDRLRFEPKVCTYQLCDFSRLFNFRPRFLYLCIEINYIIHLSWLSLLIK